MAPGGLIQVPAGSYSIDNSAGPFAINNFSGQLEFQGGARLVFSNSQNGGIWFTGGSGARIRGLRIAYSTPPLSRNSPQEGIKFSGTTDTFLADTTVENSPAAGILFFDSIRPRVVNANVQNTLADGLHFANCQDPEVNGLTTLNTGDDGLAFINYSQYTDRTGGAATNLVIRHSQARGIAVAGQSGVVVGNFVIDGTASSGVLCGQDQSYDTRAADHVLFSNGVVLNAGTVSPSVGNTYGIEYSYQTSCSFNHIEVTSSAGRGVAGMAPQGRVRLQSVRVKDNAQAEAFSFFQTAVVEVDDSTAENSPSYGFYFGQSGTVLANNLAAINTSKANPLGRAIWFEDNRRVLASGLRVIDSQQAATGYILGAFQDNVIQQGSLSGIVAVIDNGSLQVVNSSSLTIAGVLP